VTGVQTCALPIYALSQLIIELGDDTNYRIIKDTDGFDLLEIQPYETVSL